MNPPPHLAGLGSAPGAPNEPAPPGGAAPPPSSTRSVRGGVGLLLGLAVGSVLLAALPEASPTDRPIAPRAAPVQWEVDLQTRIGGHPPESQRNGFVPAGGRAEGPERALLLVDVVDAEGRPVDEAEVVAVDCPGFEGGPPGEYEVEVGPCALQAARHDGALLARGPVAAVVVGGGDPAAVQLELPPVRYGGIGIHFEPTPDGMRVLEVGPGTPAESAGLAPGDTILAVHGVSVAGMPPEWFADEVVGAEGTPVELTVGWSSDTGLAERTLHVTRAFLDTFGVAAVAPSSAKGVGGAAGATSPLGGAVLAFGAPAADPSSARWKG